MRQFGDFQFSRRALLRAAGSTLLVPTFLKRAFAQSAAPAPPSLVLMLQTNGTHQASFWPTAASGAGFTSPILANMLADPIVGPKTTLVKGINLNKLGNPGGNGHDWGWHGFYSGYDNISGSGGQFGGGPSLDHQGTDIPDAVQEHSLRCHGGQLLAGKRRTCVLRVRIGRATSPV
jgi:hypothetical protein